MVVGEKEGLKGVARLLGNNAKKLSDTDFFPSAMGIVLGAVSYTHLDVYKRQLCYC